MFAHNYLQCKGTLDAEEWKLSLLPDAENNFMQFMLHAYDENATDLMKYIHWIDGKNVFER